MRTRRTRTTPRRGRPSEVDQALYRGETSPAACLPLEGRAAPERQPGSEGKLFGRLFGLRVNLEGLPLRVMEGQELSYRIILENATGGELREVRLMETWTTDGPTILTKHRTLEIPRLGSRARHVVERRASFPAGVLSIVVAASAASSLPGVVLASDRRKRLVVRHDTGAQYGYRSAA